MTLDTTRINEFKINTKTAYFKKVFEEVRLESEIRTLSKVYIQQTMLNYKPLVYLDSGHGGYDLGANYGGAREKDLNLGASLKVKIELESMGYRVIMPRDSKKYVELTDRG